MAATNDPLMMQVVLFLHSRIINTLVGCAIGLLFIAIGGTSLIMLPLAMSVTVLQSSYVVRIQTMLWLAPISVALSSSLGWSITPEDIAYSGSGRMTRHCSDASSGSVVAWLVSVAATTGFLAD
jgi:hypothetical protein